MQFLSVQEFSKSPQVALSRVSKQGKVVLTSKGKPSVFLIKTNDKNFAKLCDMLQEIEVSQAIADMQTISEKNGNSKMSMKEVNKLIADARKSK